MTNVEIGYRIYMARKENHATLEEVAKKVGLAKSTIQRYEKGLINDVKLPNIQSIAKALNVNFDHVKCEIRQDTGCGKRR